MLRSARRGVRTALETATAAEIDFGCAEIDFGCAEKLDCLEESALRHWNRTCPLRPRL